jgi:thiopurine S-methyltransferase
MNNEKEKDQEFWKQKWVEGSTHFHNDAFNSNLVKHYPKFEKENHHVFIPLCGKTNDIFYFTEKGHKVLGVELSELAVGQFFEENKLEHKKEKSEHYKLYKTNDITMALGNLFDLTKEDLKDINFIYDRASLVALPVELRKSYYELLREKIGIGTEMLLISFEHGYDTVIGPPHSVPTKEIYENLKTHYEITSLEVKDLDIKSPKLLAQNATKATEPILYLKKIK